MKAITVRQPWASLIAAGVKTIETRSWSTQYRGPIAIHAGQKMPETGQLNTARGLITTKLPVPAASIRLGSEVVAGFPLGHVVAMANLVDVVPIDGPNQAGHHRFLCPDIGGGLTLYTFPTGYNGPAIDETDVTDERPLGDYTDGRYGWLLEDVEVLDPPVFVKGRQGLWEWVTDYDLTDQ